MRAMSLAGSKLAPGGLQIDRPFTTLRDQVWSRLVSLRKQRPLRAGPPGQEAVPWVLIAAQRNAADRHFVPFEQLLELTPFRVMTQREAAVNLGLLFTLR